MNEQEFGNYDPETIGCYNLPEEVEASKPIVPFVLDDEAFPIPEAKPDKPPIFHYTIDEPIWLGGNANVGIWEYRLTPNKVGGVIVIDWKNKKGKRTFPGRYWVSREQILNGPVQIRKGTKLRWVPIVNLYKMKTADKVTWSFVEQRREEGE